MSSYRIFETRELLAALERLDEQQRRFIEPKLRRRIYLQLKEQPHYGVNIRKVRGYAPDTWRYRLGRFRLFYTINEPEKIVAILTVDDRKDAYR